MNTYTHSLPLYKTRYTSNNVLSQSKLVPAVQHLRNAWHPALLHTITAPCPHSRLNTLTGTKYQLLLCVYVWSASMCTSMFKEGVSSQNNH